jgi:hypothetical protein
MNTNVENTFATYGKSAVKSETGQKIVKALKQDKDVMKEFTKAKNN